METINYINSMKFWCQKVLPLVYDDSLSYYEVLGKVVAKVNELVDNNELSKNILDRYGTTINQLIAETNKLNEELEKVKSGDYVNLYLDSIINYIDKNLVDIVSRIVKFVFFGLSDDGYFIAYIPDSWKFIKFDTIMDYNNPYYGSLVLKYGG